MTQENSILIVEDEWLIADELQANLERHHYRVVGIAASGKDAIDQAETHQPSLVLMDIVLKGEMDGIGTAAEIYGRFKIPVIYLTAYTDKATIGRAKETTPFGYLVKPVEEHQLIPIIEMALVRHQLEQERETLIGQLQKAQTEIEMLQTFLPICSSCKKIRDNEGSWQLLESYFHNHTSVEFSHGICPDCLKTLYPTLYGDSK